MRGILVTLIVCGLLVYTLKRPHIGILLWSWLSYMNPHRLTWGFAYSMPFAQMTAAVTLLATLASAEPKHLPLTPVTVVWILFIAWMSFTTVFALYPEFAIPMFETVIKVQLMALLTLILMNSRERIHQLVWVIAMSIAFFGIKGGIFAIRTGGEFLVWGPPQSFIGGNNEIALALIVILPLLRYLQLQTTNKRLGWALYLAMALCGVAAISSYSRGAYLAGGAMACMMVLKTRNKIFFGLIIAAVVVGGLSFMPEQYGERIGTIGSYEEDKSAQSRINTWWFAFNLAKDRPIVGGGFETFEDDVYRIYAPVRDGAHDAHSIYFLVLAEHGFVGLGLFLLLGLLAMRTGTWILRHTRKRPDLRWANDLAAMIQVSFVGFAVGGAFLGLSYWDLPYHLIAILVLTRQVVERELQPKPVAAGEPAGASPTDVVRTRPRFGHRPRYGHR